MVIFYTFIIWLITSVVLYSQIINVQIIPNTPQVGDSTKITITQVNTTTTTIKDSARFVVFLFSGIRFSPQ